MFSRDALFAVVFLVGLVVGLIAVTIIQDQRALLVVARDTRAQVLDIRSRLEGKPARG